MNSTPYQNEPGYEIERKSGDIQRYFRGISQVFIIDIMHVLHMRL